ncbi:Dam family site-specific DNA-(adenine-N6)-methyltransferase [Coprothermobacteraceae bacterium]|nr:Dam family site-specific DNA-(adenine-N6)-methyltransferase [Coprothermobacteraceae bacterium]
MKVDKVRIPPVKCQGIKTRLVQFILSSVRWDGEGRWVEPFLGSGVVAFNLAPERALLADTNVHIIRLYQDIATGRITPEMVREFLEQEGNLLLTKGEEHYYEVRERFNKEPSSLDFLFLSRAGFNGVMRFNRQGEFNVPFCRKPERFRQAYITKIVNQVAWVAEVTHGKDWTFKVADWRETLAEVRAGDFVYADPPYAGRHTDYYNGWTDKEAIELLDRLRSLPCGFALSSWKRNKYRSNPHLANTPSDVVVKTFPHFYHVGSREEFRNEIEEALVVSKDYTC